jgi:hypothetical protein
MADSEPNGTKGNWSNGNGNGNGKHPASERREYMLLQLRAGIPPWKASRLTADHWQQLTGRRPSDRTLRRDTAAIAEEIKKAFDCPDQHELTVGVVFERLGKRAVKADAAGAFNAATQADKLTLWMMGIRSRRWEPKAAKVSVTGEVNLADRERVLAGYRRLAELDGPALLERRQALQERLDALGWQGVVDDQAEATAAAPEPAATGTD